MYLYLYLHITSLIKIILSLTTLTSSVPGVTPAAVVLNGTETPWLSLRSPQLCDGQPGKKKEIPDSLEGTLSYRSVHAYLPFLNQCLNTLTHSQSNPVDSHHVAGRECNMQGKASEAS